MGLRPGRAIGRRTALTPRFARPDNRANARELALLSCDVPKRQPAPRRQTHLELDGPRSARAYASDIEPFRREPAQRRRSTRRRLRGTRPTGRSHPSSGIARTDDSVARLRSQRPRRRGERNSREVSARFRLPRRSVSCSRGGTPRPATTTSTGRPCVAPSASRLADRSCGRGVQAVGCCLARGGWPGVMPQSCARDGGALCRGARWRAV
jgi:hypothetical protein